MKTIYWDTNEYNKYNYKQTQTFIEIQMRRMKRVQQDGNKDEIKKK